VKFLDWLYIFVLVCLFLVLWRFRQIVLLVFLATVIALVLNSVARALVNRLKFSRSVAVFFTITLLTAAVTVFTRLILPPFLAQFQELLAVLPDALNIVSTRADAFITEPPEWLPQTDVQLLPNASELIKEGGLLAKRIFGDFFNFFSSFLAVLLQILLLLLLTLMMLAEPQVYRNLLVRAFPAFYRDRADEIFGQCEIGLLGWVKGVSINSTFVALASGIGLAVIGIPFAYANALLAGLFNFIPNIGPTLSSICPILLALSISPQKAIQVLILYVIIQNVESYIISPLAMKEQVSLVPAVTLVAQLFFTALLGPFGLALALPLTIVLKTWLEEAWIKDILDNWLSRSQTSLTAAREVTPAVVVESQETNL